MTMPPKMTRSLCVCCMWLSLERVKRSPCSYLLTLKNFPLAPGPRHSAIFSRRHSNNLKPLHIDQSLVGELEARNHRQRQESKLQKWLGEPTANRARRAPQPLQALDYLLGRLTAHQPRNGQL